MGPTMRKERYRPLAGIPTSVLKDRTAALVERVRGKSVLDVGCTGTKAGVSHPRYRYLHHHLADAAGEILGVDLDAPGIEAMREAGFKVQVGDVETMDLGRQFQIIVAGEIIEHLPNPGLFLRNLRRHLMDDGEILITTPNPFRISQVWKILKYDQVRVHREHTLWMCPSVLKRLLEICELRMVELCWIRDSRWFLPPRWPALLRSYWHNNFLAVARKA